ncbi:hypothetical protein BJX64DRAFT_293802 [Aspergillus heterothallicus]
MVYETINPDIKGLEGQMITPYRLHAIQRKQASTGNIWKDPHGGYLDFVTHLHDLTYLRLYVGQSKHPDHRLPQHMREIIKGSISSLHNFILNNSEGLRTADFIRLWTVVFPPRTDAFQSLPAATLEAVFGACPQGQYSGIGLNIVSPLLQGKHLSPQVRRHFTELLRRSPDPEIRQWPDIRKEHPISQKSGFDGIPSRIHVDKESCYEAIRQTIDSSSFTEELVYIQIDKDIWAPFEVALADPQIWAQ